MSRSDAAAMEGEAVSASPPATPAAARRPRLAPLSSVSCDATDGLIQHRFIWLAIIAVLFLLAFNGEWRIGRDSAMYRGLAHHLATGRGYTFGIFASTTVYPGYPLLLAAIEKVFGTGALAPILVTMAMTVASLVMTYRLIALRYPRWTATGVVILLGFNSWLLQLSGDLLTDIPYFLGVLLALYGWERLRLAAPEPTTSDAVGPDNDSDGDAGGAVRRGWRRWGAPVAYLVAGLLIAASTRPTFWVLAAAWAAAAVWGLVRGRRRKLNFALLAGVIVVAVAFVFLDPRTRGFQPLGGGAERDVMLRIQDARATLAETLPPFLHETFPEAFFGAEMPGVLAVVTVFLVLAPALLLMARGHVMWGLLILGTVAATLLSSTAPRYYLNVLPLLLLGWLLILVEIARRIPPRFHHALMIAGFAAIIVPNLIRGVRVIADQRYRDPGNLKDWGDEIRMAELIKQTLPPDAKVIGPGAPIMSYFSDRQVYMAREIIPRSNHLPDIPEYLAGQGIEYAVFPSALYARSEWLIGELMNRGVIVPLERVGATDEMVLATIRIAVPPHGSSWRRNRLTDAATIEAIRQLPSRTENRDAARERAAAKQRARAKAAKERKDRRTMELIWNAVMAPVDPPSTSATAPVAAGATPSPGTPGEGGGEGDFGTSSDSPRSGSPSP